MAAFYKMKTTVQFLTEKSVKQVIKDNESLLFVDDKAPLEVAFKVIYLKFYSSNW